MPSSPVSEPIRLVRMVVPRLQWPQLPGWATPLLRATRKRSLEEDDEADAMEVVGQHKDNLVPPVKKQKPTPPCAQCRAGVPGHWGHIKQG